MVTIGRLPKRIVTEEPGFNPYQLVEVTVAGQVVLARPFEFDSEPVDGLWLNAEHQRIKPLRFSASCPSCGHEIIVDRVDGPLVGVCNNCGAGAGQSALPPEDPFQNPIAAGLIFECELKPEIESVAGVVKLLNRDSRTVADKIEQRRTERNDEQAQ